jgi:hypothetical protein
MEAILSSEMSVHTGFTRRHIPEDGILHSHSSGYLKSYIGFIYRQNRNSHYIDWAISATKYQLLLVLKIRQDDWYVMSWKGCRRKCRG